MNKYALIAEIKTPILGKITSLDALLTYALAQRLEGDFEKASQELPLIKTEGLYHASTGIVENAEPFRTTYIASLHANHWLDIDQIKKNARTGKHPRLSDKRKREFGNVMHEHTGTFGNNIWFFFEGDGEAVLKLMQDLPFIGKKNTTGWGELGHLELEEASVNGVLDRNNYPLRAIPEHLYQGVINDEVIIADTTWKPPYWAFENRDKCYIKSKKYDLEELENMLVNE